LIFGEASFVYLRPSFSFSVSTPPPPLPKKRYAGFDFPDEWTESLKTTLERVAPYFDENIVPVLKSGKTVIIAAHGNSLRALVKGLDGIGEDVIAELNIPTGTPLVYELDENMRPIPQDGSFGPLNGRYLGDQDAIRARIEGVKNQTK
jgi:2,3-bisphosphoglycerate-dependent phosphoglycerate mutase